MNEIFAYFLKRDNEEKDTINKRFAYADWFCSTYPVSEFSNDDRIMIEILIYATKLGTPISEKLIEIYEKTRLKELLVKEHIHVNGTQGLDYDDIQQLNTSVEITKELLSQNIRHFIENMDGLVIEEFPMNVDAWRLNQLSERLMAIYSNGYEMINTVKDKEIGAKDALNYTKTRIDILSEIYDEEKLTELGYFKDSVAKEFKFITDYGIPSIDTDMSGIYTTNLIGHEGSPGKGKTRFTIGTAAYRACVVHKKNVLYYGSEQNVTQIKAMFIARHLYETQKIVIADKLIARDTVSEKYKSLVSAARFDLFESGNYGKLEIMSDVIYLETFLSKFRLKDSLQEGGFDLFILDHASLIDQKEPTEFTKYTKRLDQWTITTRAYKIFKRWLMATNKAGIIINQLTRDGSKEADKSGDSDATGGSGGMETYRSTDYNIVIAASKAMEAQCKRWLINPKKRDSAGIGKTVVNTRMEICYMIEEEKTFG